MRTFNHVAKLLKKYRQSHPKKYSQAELSKLLGYKNGQFISNIERGLCSIPLKNLNQVVIILGVPKQELYNAVMQDFEVTVDHYMKLSPDKQKVGMKPQDNSL